MYNDFICINRLIADVVHKIKNGLGGIGGYATLLEKELDSDDAQKRFVKKINEGVIGVNEITLKLMSLVRIRELQKEKVKIEYLFREILKNISNNDEDLIDKLNFDKSFEQKYIEIVSDQEVLSELFKNAILFLKEINGKILKILIKVSGDKNLSIEIFFEKDLKEYVDISDYIKQLMQDSRHLYARLCFAITQIMVNLLDGKYLVFSENDNINILKLEI